MMSVFWREIYDDQIALVLALSSEEKHVAHLYLGLDDKWYGVFADHETGGFEDLQEAKRELLGLTRQVAQVIHDKVKQNQSYLESDYVR